MSYKILSLDELKRQRQCVTHPMREFENLKRTGRLNRYLVCPKGYIAQRPNRQPKLYRIEPAALSDAWRHVIAQQPRTTEIIVRKNGLHLHHTQKSKIFGFIDDIYTNVVATEGGATLYIYSASRLGIFDFAVNKNRINDWCSALDLALQS